MSAAGHRRRIELPAQSVGECQAWRGAPVVLDEGGEIERRVGQVRLSARNLYERSLASGGFVDAVEDGDLLVRTAVESRNEAAVINTEFQLMRADVGREILDEIELPLPVRGVRAAEER